LLSGLRVRSYATCHNPGLAWGDGEPRAIGENQVRLPLRSPMLLDVAWVPKLGWAGHFPDLESVAMGPITEQNNMNLPEKELIDRLSAIPAYVAAFDSAFGGGGVTRQRIEQSLATCRLLIAAALPLACVFDALLAQPASAHVKWFCAYDVAGQRSFIRELGKDDCLAIIRAVMRLGSSLGMIITAEGVETEEQLDILRAEGCMQVQGYLFSKAVPAAEITLLLRRLRPRIRAA
jgi:hypothetical protein